MPKFIEAENSLILEVAKQINVKHFLILQKAKIEQNRLLGLSVLENNPNKYEQQIAYYQNILDVFRMEQLAQDKNPYSVLANMQRLHYINRKYLSKLKKLRKSNFLDKEQKEESINLLLSQLEKKLQSDYSEIVKELHDIDNRKKAYHDIMVARSAAKKLKLVKEKVYGDYFYVNLTTSLGETIAGITRNILLVTKHAGNLSQAMPMIGAACVLISTLITIMTLKPSDLEGHKLFNTSVTIFAGLIDTLVYGFTISKDFAPAIASKISWVPYLGTGLTWMMLGVEIINLTYLEIRYHKELKAVHSICADPKQLSDMSWLFDKDLKGLCGDQKKFKYVFDRHVSTIRLSSHDKKIILDLFNSGQFQETFKPTLVEHIKRERYKRLCRHAINVSIVLIFITAGMITVFFPAFALIIAIALIAFTIASTLAKISIFNTVLKEQKITIEKLIPDDYIFEAKLEEQKDLSLGLRGSKRPENSQTVVQKLFRFCSGQVKPSHIEGELFAAPANNMKYRS